VGTIFFGRGEGVGFLGGGVFFFTTTGLGLGVGGGVGFGFGITFFTGGVGLGGKIAGARIGGEEASSKTWTSSGFSSQLGINAKNTIPVASTR
tara:strand:- start:2323 stop:2601 length:279 start_codon:yes stop_codon:yes gene_type:complete